MKNNKKESVIVDIDNCLLDSRELIKLIPKNKYDRIGWDIYNSNLHLCKPNKIIVDYVKYLSNFYHIVFLTARENVCDKEKNIYTPTETCISIKNSCNLYPSIDCKLIMRDFEDYRESHVVKEDKLVNKILPEYNVILAIDDEIKNIEMYKSYGIPTMHYDMNLERKQIEINQ